MRARFLAARVRRGAVEPGTRRHLDCGGPADTSRTLAGPARARWEVGFPPDEVDELAVRREQRLAAFGFEPDDLNAASFMEQQGAEPIGSLRYDGPLAALASRRPNLADFLHETVAVVTNPAIDREREIEHFSTRVVVGPRPLPQRGGPHRAWIETAHPVLLGGHAAEAGLAPDEARAIARRLGTWRVEDLIDALRVDARGRGPAVLDADRDWEEPARDALARLGAEACRAVRAGARAILVQDRHVFEEGRVWLDPLLVVAAAHGALRVQPSPAGTLRPECAILLSSGSVRNLHNLVVALGLGADAVNPYLLIEHALATGDPDALPNLIEALRKGLEKVISTLGIHELRGYGRAFSAIGLAPDVARLVGVATFGASADAGYGWEPTPNGSARRSWASAKWRTGNVGGTAIGSRAPASPASACAVTASVIAATTHSSTAMTSRWSAMNPISASHETYSFKCRGVSCGSARNTGPTSKTRSNAPTSIRL